MNIATLLHETARYFGDRPAISWRGETLSYDEFQRRSAAFGAWLSTVSAAPAGRVLLYLDNCPELLIAMFGTFWAGSTVVPCNSRLTLDELAFIAQDCDVRVIVTDAAHADAAHAAAGPDRLVLTAGVDFATALAAPADSLEPVSLEPVSLEPVGVEPVGVDSAATAWIFYTSGTTGRPKGAMLPHAVLNFVTVSWLADLTTLDETDVTLHLAPLSHGAGFHALAAVARGAHQVIPDTTSFDPAATLRLIRDAGVTNTWMVPTQIVMLTDAVAAAAAAGEPTIAIPTLRYLVYGGAPITPAAISRALDTFGPVFVQLFAQGETPMTATMLRRQDHRPELLGSAGRARLGTEVRIVGPDDQPLPDGEIGELVVRGPSVMSGYWNRPDATAETIVDGWLHTGDLGRRTDDGVFWLLDRAKDMIISGGSNVYAVEVETALTTHPDVREVAVIGLADDLWGELVAAVVVPHDGAAVDDAALTTHCRATLAGYKLPRRYFTAESLPRNAYGKVLKRELRRLANDGQL